MSKGALLMVISSFVFSVAYVFVKKISLAVGFWEAAFLRSLMGTILLTGYLLSKGTSPFGKPSNRPLLLLRGFLGATSMVLYYMAFQKTSMANASALHFTHPLFTTLLAVPLLKEHVRPKRVGIIIIALVGVGLVFRPSRGVISVGALAGLASGVFASLAYLSIRSLADKEEKAAIINALCIGGVLLTLPFTFRTWQNPSPTIWLSVLLVGSVTTLAQYLMTSAYKLEPASSVAGFSFVAIIWSLLFGKVIFGEIPSALELVGIGTIFVTMVGLAMDRRGAR